MGEIHASPKGYAGHGGNYVAPTVPRRSCFSRGPEANFQARMATCQEAGSTREKVLLRLKATQTRTRMGTMGIMGTMWHLRCREEAIYQNDRNNCSKKAIHFCVTPKRDKNNKRATIPPPPISEPKAPHNSHLSHLSHSSCKIIVDFPQLI